MQRLLRPLGLVLGIAVFVLACARVPYTGRAQYNVIPDSILQGLGAQAFTDVVSQASLRDTGEDHEVFTRVGRRIADVSGEGGQWSFALIEDDQVNAFALPGGHVAFYTGILPVLRSEAGMAFVMGHEVGHVLAEHGGERLTQQLTLLGGLTGLELVLGGQTDLTPEQRRALLGALGLGAEIGVLLPFSRTHEGEADVIGMMLMARAGYPPTEALDLWQRMAEAQEGRQPPAFLSTHPPHEERREILQEWLPRAERRYQRNALPQDTTVALWEGDGRPAAPGEEEDRRRRDRPDRERPDGPMERPPSR